MNITAIAGNSGTSNTQGIRLDSGSNISSGGSNSVITTTGATSGTARSGIELRAGSAINNTGNMTITGTASSGSFDGVRLTSGNITNGTGILSITGIPSGAGSGINIVSGAIGGAGSSGPVTLTSNTFNLVGTVSILAAGGTVVIQPIAGSDSLGLGTSGGTLALSNAQIAQISAANGVFFGRADQQVLNAGGATFTNALTTLRADTITIDNPLNAGANTLNFQTGLNGTGTFNLDNTITSGSSTLFGIGSPEDNTLLAGLNTTNSWNVTANDAGTITTPTFTMNFSNVGNLTGGTMNDTFSFADQQGLSGIVDGGDQTSADTLDYTAFTTPALISFLNPPENTEGLASNIAGGVSI